MLSAGHLQQHACLSVEISDIFYIILLLLLLLLYLDRGDTCADETSGFEVLFESTYKKTRKVLWFILLFLLIIH